jgi:hypothetical protein
VQVDRRGVLECLDLLLDPGGDVGMAVAAGHGDDPGEEIEIAAARLVEDVLHPPFDDHERLAVQREQRRVGVVPAGRQDLGAGRTVVGPRRVIERRHARWSRLRESRGHGSLAA